MEDQKGMAWALRGKRTRKQRAAENTPRGIYLIHGPALRACESKERLLEQRFNSHSSPVK
jgi:hypothetical protein